MPIRPRRSMLYVPGDKTRALEKARTLPVDAIIIDLEDAVAPERKVDARDIVAQALSGDDYGPRELLLRVGGIDVAEDFALAAGLPLDGVVLPKVESGPMVAQAAERIALPIWCMIETPLGVLRAADIAAAPRMAGLIAGTNDLNKELHARHRPDRATLLTSLSLIVLAARAHGLAAIDGVHLDLDDDAGLEAVCIQGRDMGFDGKTLIHPATIDIANRVFAPEPDAVDTARRIVAAWADARAKQLGVARIDGRMVEQLHVDEAERLIAIADAIGAREYDPQ
ncbi:CoA ester lyase [Stakelama sp. CBK3Z-3]|uniref:CoA ester lyase n=1 Tax=Stakelama flava TaxID=2860338 RepID=A0ABS6XK65_9SPHN|nr:CoA ester lyase [Stakelama flava]MBW4330546.1 CoA ester lyase [Stakelama flava]